MNDSTGTSTPAGWYADPAGSDRLRWWDGTRWTDHLSDAPAAASSAAASSASSAGDAPAATSSAESAPAAAADPSTPPVAPPVAPAIPPVSAPQQQYAQQPAAGQPSAQQPYAQQPYAQQAYVAPTPPPQVPASTSPFTWAIWVIVALPILLVLAFAAWDARDYFTAATSGRMAFDTGYVLIQLLGFLVYGATVALAFLDFRELGRRGIVRPFHWAWAFLGGTVYIIGRSIIVRRRIEGTPASALIPLWVWIAVNLVTFFIVMVKVVDAVSSVMMQYGPSRF